MRAARKGVAMKWFGTTLTTLVVAASFAAFGQQPGPAKELPSNSPSAHSVVLTPQALERQVRSQPSDKLKR